MAAAARYVFKCSSDAHEQIIQLFDFISPTSIALWNLRWQVKGFLSAAPEASSENLVARFALGSGFRGGEIKNACVNTSWDRQLEIFANIALTNLIAIFEDFCGRLAGLTSGSSDQHRAVTQHLQFPGGALVINGAPNRGLAATQFGNPSTALAGVFIADPRYNKRDVPNEIDALLQCYRFFKSIRNAIAHNGGRSNKEALNNYTRFTAVASTSALGIGEVPLHDSILSEKQSLRLNIRGVTGLSNVILRIITTYDSQFSRTVTGESELITRMQPIKSGNRTFPMGSDVEKRVRSMFRAAGFPEVSVTKDLVDFLIAKKIIPEYATL